MVFSIAEMNLAVAEMIFSLTISGENQKSNLFCPYASRRAA